MRVLMLHNRYLGQGGEDVSFAMEIDLLRAHGWEVTAYEENNERIAELGLTRTAVNTIWSQETYRRVRAELARANYDIVHVQNFFPLISPSVYYAARAERVPVVQALRNYRLLCPASTLMREGRVCEKCLGKTVAWPGMLHACYRQSRAGTAVVAAMLASHWLVGTWSRLVDAYIVLTRFGRDKFIAGGLPPDRIFIRSNYLHPDPKPGRGGGEYAIFVGRLDEQKGVRNLLAAWQKPGRRLPLRIVGDGPLRSLVTEAAGRCASIQWLGQRTGGEALDLIGDAAFVILPSESYEGQPRVIIESFAKGTPVIASRLGAMAEMVEDDHTGFLVRCGDPEALAERADWASGHPKELRRMRQNARAKFEAEFTAERNYERLLGIYAAARKRAGLAPLPPAAQPGVPGG